METAKGSRALNRIELMRDGKPSEEVVARMADTTYRRRVLRQMLEQRYTPEELSVADVNVDALDHHVQDLIKVKFPGLGPTEKNQLYLDLCLNQSLLQQALEAWRVAHAMRLSVTQVISEV
jgi:hypothetical protein